MSKVRFLQDFQGKETREVFYKKDQVVEIDDNLVDRLVSDGRAERVTERHYGGQDSPELKPRADEVIYKEVQAENAASVMYFDDEPQFENAAEPPRPTKKQRGKK